LLYDLITVGEALELFGSDYDDRIAAGEVDAMCGKLSYHVTQRDAPLAKTSMSEHVESGAVRSS
jgi:hypothetical protein